MGPADVKAGCRGFVDPVRESRAEYIVTRNGRPVARLVPVEPSEAGAFIGSMKGSVLGYDAPFEPVPGVWHLDHGPSDDE